MTPAATSFNYGWNAAQPRPLSFRVYEQRIEPAVSIFDPRDAQIDRQLVHTWRWSTASEEAFKETECPPPPHQ